MSTKLISLLVLLITSINGIQANTPLCTSKEIEIAKLSASLAGDTPTSSEEGCTYALKEVLESGKYIVLEDESRWLVASRSKGTVQKWESDDRLKIFIDPSKNIQFKNIDKSNDAGATLEVHPRANLGRYILRLSNSVFDPDDETKLILNNGLIFAGPRISWKVRDVIYILHNSSGSFEMWNLTRNLRSTQWRLVGSESEGSSESIFTIESRLGQRVLGQEDVIKNIAETIFNCWAGLNDPQAPLGVFLFLGPTGVGKTELAKALVQELYKTQKRLIRFDMSQFPDASDYTRLIGSPPGYVNHEEGGQLTEALRARPQSIVLLDEMEKAHPSIRKAFLPVFDEGYISDAKNRKILCNRAIFIMTGNIASEEIAHLFNAGYDTEEVMQMIEPAVIGYLSPELYNRATTVVFRPISQEIMENLVDQKLIEVAARLKTLKAMNLVVDEAAKNYLIINGFHPTLGARPLKRLIQSKVTASLSYAIIHEGIPEGSTLYLSYSFQDDTWHIEWHN